MHGEVRNVCKSSVGKPKRNRDYSEDLDEDRRIILEWTLKKQVGMTWNRFIWLRIATSGGSF
jgi:hypothetical protein